MDDRRRLEAIATYAVASAVSTLARRLVGLLSGSAGMGVEDLAAEVESLRAAARLLDDKK